MRVQRFSLAGSRLWLTPAGVTMSGAVKLAEDGVGGSYLAGPAGAGIVVRHLLSTGAEATGSPSALPGLGMSQPRVDAVSANRAGDLTVAYSDAATPSDRRAGRLPRHLPRRLGHGDDRRRPRVLHRRRPRRRRRRLRRGRRRDSCASPRPTRSPCAPRARLVQYGKSVTVAGYLTGAGGLPVSGAQVQVRRVTGRDHRRRGHRHHGRPGLLPDLAPAPVQRDLDGRSPAAPRGEEALIRVMPRVTLALSHLKAGTVLTEIFTGGVAPAHDGQRVLIQKAVGSGWRTVASGRLDGSSRYRISWRLPYRTATYKLRAVIPAHADHAQGTSVTGTLKVVVREGVAPGAGPSDRRRRRRRDDTPPYAATGRRASSGPPPRPRSGV